MTLLAAQPHAMLLWGCSLMRKDAFASQYGIASWLYRPVSNSEGTISSSGEYLPTISTAGVYEF